MLVVLNTYRARIKYHQLARSIGEPVANRGLITYDHVRLDVRKRKYQRHVARAKDKGLDKDEKHR